MANQKAHERNQLILEFGILIQPFTELARSDTPPIAKQYGLTRAKVASGDAAWRKMVKSFTTIAPDVFMSHEHQLISHVPEQMMNRVSTILKSYADDPAEMHDNFKEEINSLRLEFFDFIEMVPVEYEPMSFEANTPYTAYLRIKEVIGAAKRRVHYFDRYVKAEFFDLFLPALDRAVSLRIVTTKGKSDYGVTAVRSVASLVAQEFTDFQLIEVQPKQIHDRHLRVDDSVFHLGPGVDKAGVALTSFGPADNSESMNSSLDTIIAEGVSTSHV